MANSPARSSSPTAAPARAVLQPVQPALERTAIPFAARALAYGPLLLVPVGLVVGLVGVLALGLLLAVLGVLLTVATLRLGRPERLLALLPATPVDPVRDARLVNVVDGLCAAAGLPVPAICILSDDAANAIVLGRSARSATLLCTTGLLARVDRMALEGVVAHELAHIRRGDLERATAAMAAGGLLVSVLPGTAPLIARFAGVEREALADQAAAGLTRYPPGVAAALEVLRGAPSTRPTLASTVARFTAAMWCAPLAETGLGPEVPGALGLDLRIAALAEL